MIFQTLDDKDKCVGFYIDGQLVYDEIPANLTKTWKYTRHLNDADVEFANLYCPGSTLDEMCPTYLRADWLSITDKLKAFLLSFREAKISLNDNCFFELVPDRFLLEYCELKNEITEHVLENYEKPKNYDFNLKINKIVEDIRYRNLNIDLSQLSEKASCSKVRNFIKKIKSTEPYVKYDMFKSKTGRLVTSPGSIPILTLDKNHRAMLKPNNDCFIELDFNAAELRTMLGLLGMSQPENDLHEWNAKNVFRGLLSREESKKRIFSWLYNPNSKDYLAARHYDRKKIKSKFWNGQEVETIFNRQIPSDEFHSVNYIVQSTTSDIFLDRAYEVFEFLKNKKSYIAFCIHDSLVIDLALQDKEDLDRIIDIFSNTKLGKYSVNVCAGTDFKNMENFTWR